MRVARGRSTFVLLVTPDAPGTASKPGLMLSNMTFTDAQSGEGGVIVPLRLSSDPGF
jgi:hypothetical protein